MGNKTAPYNPFYSALVVVGILFVLTACCYFVMAMKGVSPPADAGRDRQFMELIDRHGLTAMLVELGLLAAAAVGAMVRDARTE